MKNFNNLFITFCSVMLMASTGAAMLSAQRLIREHYEQEAVEMRLKVAVHDYLIADKAHENEAERYYHEALKDYDEMTMNIK